MKIKSIQGFNEDIFEVPPPGATTPTAAPTTTPAGDVTATPEATSNNTGPGDGLPLLPFAVLSAVGLVGLATGKMSRKK